MSEKPTTRKRRRWRWMTLCVVVIVAWWFWPRGDTDYAGQWACWFEANPKPVSRIVLHGNGGGTTWKPDGSVVDHFNWRVDGNQLVFGPILGRAPSSILQWRTLRTAGWGFTFLPEEVRFEIVSRKRDVIRCRTVDGKERVEFELRRIESP